MNEAPRPAATLLPWPYQADSRGYFHTVAAALPQPVLLQSDPPGTAARGRFDILTAAPLYWLERRRDGLHWHGTVPDGLAGQPYPDSLSALGAALAQLVAMPADLTAVHAQALPFCGGLIGYLAYDLAREYLPLPDRAIDDIDVPTLQFGFYPWALVQDHARQASWLVFHPACPPALQQAACACLAEPVAAAQPPAPTATAGVTQSNLDEAGYRAAFARIQAYIQAGDCYQINFAQRFSLPAPGPALALYDALRAAMPSPFCAYLPILGSTDTVMSFSPERFLQCDAQGQVSTQPIKGTAPRDPDPVRDRAHAERLQHDPKNRAENVMIVDLLRNDLGRVCATGSVQVAQLCELQSFANVHHLVSTITGQLRPACNGADLLRACFPGGSITGAPKIRAMQIIEELEPHRRSVYCGALACFSADGRLDSNILIRTVLHHRDTLYCWGGGGIVSDSAADSEYRESQLKVQVLLDTLLGKQA